MSLKSVIEKMPGYNKLVLPVHYLQAVQAGMKYGRPAKKLRVIGVTGTNGKTTTSFMIWKMLNESGRKCGLLTTVGWSVDGEHLQKQVEHMTTERVGVLNERMRKVADAGAEFLVLEVTSHALAQYRTLGVPIEIAVFTNLTHEHLDYHGTFENYRKAKLRLFEGAKCGVVNADDPSASFFEKASCATNKRIVDNGHSSSLADARLVHRTLSTAHSDAPDASNNNHSRQSNGGGESCNSVITYGIKQGDMRATDIKLSATGVEYACGEMKIRTQIPGEFNVYNSLAAVCVGKKLGLSDKEIEDGIYALESVEGRMNRVQCGQNYTVIVDYAHTPDALEKVFSSVGLSSPRISSLESATAPSPHAKCGSVRCSALPRTSSEISKPDNIESRASNEQSKIIAVHGGAGRRDESTRFIRGEILGKYADVVIITEDDSRDEDPEKIAAEFVRGAEKFGKIRDKDLFVDLDRRSAIKKALEMAKKDDLVLILGKGHEKTILRADGAHEFEDIKVVKELLAK